MKVIYKYPCPAPGGSLIQWVANEEIIHVGLDGQNFPCFWVEMDQDVEHGIVEFFVVGTGWELPEKKNFLGFHVGSWIEGQFVWHLYRWVEQYGS